MGIYHLKSMKIHVHRCSLWFLCWSCFYEPIVRWCIYAVEYRGTVHSDGSLSWEHENEKQESTWLGYLYIGLSVYQRQWNFS